MKIQALLFLSALILLPSCKDDEEGGLTSYITCPNDHHPHLIDLGLPSGTKWSCCNIGATTPEQYGSYYAWGETVEKTEYGAENYKYCTWEDKNGNGKYDLNDGDPLFQQIGDDIAGTDYDVARVKWGETWKMPTLEQINELLRNCTWSWTPQNGINGVRIVGRNRGTIFLPAAYYYREDRMPKQGLSGFYWSSNPYLDYDASYLMFDSISWDSRHYHRSFRYYGYPVRAVSK